MNALVWLGPRSMELREEPIPSPGDGEALIRVRAVGVCGSELSGYLGHSSIRKPPLIMGHEIAGVIHQTGSGRLADGTEARVGQRVAVNPLISCGECRYCRDGKANLCPKRVLLGAHRAGAFADYVAVPVSQCWPLPDALSDEAGAMAEPLACAVRAIDRSGLMTGESLLILGAGAIGLFCLVEARIQGAAAALISDPNPDRLVTARSHGADRAIHSAQEDVVTETLSQFPDGVDLVIDAVGIEATRRVALQAVRPGGRILALGLHQEESPMPMGALVRREVEIIGSYAYTNEDFQAALRHLSEGLVRIDASWMEERPLSAGKSAFDDLLGDAPHATKIVLKTM